ncbi:HAD-IIA family hydrolase [Maribellus sp. YY47]|uniref:HAD-IIA family hydrolase n=1 Tax=Maribellus sp. YY47 TaxID=2929486 RepID=UPI00200124F6|nr:HAD-IIA family hydrolase [Maribellus sp. YY47]MCK3684731.1 HAD-IIA family hydrolase [Maribellus sp. YY47]
MTTEKIHLSTFDTKQAVLERLGKIKHVALDMDGTIYKGSTLFPFTSNFLKKLKNMGIGYSFLTNNPSKCTEDYLKHLRNMGIEATREELYTTAQATISYLKSNHPDKKRLFILGTKSMITEFERAGFESLPDDPAIEPDAVVVAFDLSLTYARLARAAWWINQGKTYVATNPDYVCPTDEPITLVDCGSICAALEKATGRTPVVLGKPQPEMLDGILTAHQLEASEVAMVGDRIYTDILMAHNANALGVLVLSGEATLDDARNADPRPHLVVDNIAVLGELLQEAFSCAE